MKMKFENLFGRKNKDEKDHTKRAGANTARIFAAGLAVMGPNAAVTGVAAELGTKPTTTEQIFHPGNKEIILTTDGKKVIEKISKMKYDRETDFAGKEVIKDSFDNQMKFLKCVEIVDTYINDNLGRYKPGEPYVNAEGKKTAVPANYHYNPAKELQDIVILGMGIVWKDASLQTHMIFHLEKKLKELEVTE